MDKSEYAAARAGALAKMLTISKDASIDQLCSLVCGLLDAAGLSPEQRIDVLGGAFVSEAIRPHWADPSDARAAHQDLRRADEELADAVEALAHVLLGRTEAREEGALAIQELERLLAQPRDGQSRLPGC